MGRSGAGSPTGAGPPGSGAARRGTDPLLRRHNYQTHVAAHVDFGGMTGRNQDAVKKTTAGLLKLVFPHRTAEDLERDELEMCLALAIECRQRVLDQLAVMLPEKFGGGEGGGGEAGVTGNPAHIFLTLTVMMFYQSTNLPSK